MFFNSIDFIFFLPLVFIFYWFVTKKNLKLQNLLIVSASYFFYGCWDWRFLSLIILSTLLDFSFGKKLSSTENNKRRKLILFASLFVNLGILGFFKYYNFFIDSFAETFTFFGSNFDPNGLTLKIILPVGISFYTFQTLSYSIDVYRRKLEPSNDIIAFSAFVSFFPQLVAGPIERATNLLPQFSVKREFNYLSAVNGCRQILWGLFKKVVIADNAAVYANLIFEDAGNQSGSTLVLGAVFFAFQIYGDFSGYSDIAIGISRLFGFDLKKNFSFPYFSRDIAEFWRRWHISLSTWFRDYLYIPLGGSKGGLIKSIRNIFIIFIVSGFWHGANWTFIAWGALNAIYFLPYMLLKRNRKNIDVVANEKAFPSLSELISIGLTFMMTCFAWIFFRAENMNEAFIYIKGIFSKSLFSVPEYRPSILLVLIFAFVLIEWNGRRNEYAVEKFGFNWPKYARRSFYYVLTLLVIFFQGQKVAFIYFQF